jgi:hypothetical protein
MNRKYGDSHYSSHRVEDRAEGYVGFDLMRLQNSKSDLVVRILFWDACGQFVVETLGTCVPLEILEELITEAKESIKTA